MLKTKILMILAAAISALVVSASSAIAFESENGVTTEGQATAAAEITLTVSPGNSAVKCTSSGALQHWKLPGGVSVTITISILKFGICSAKVSGTFVTAEVKPCELSVTQAAQDALVGTGGVVTTCEVKVSKCVIVVSSTSNRGGLESVSLEESGANVKIVPKVKGVTTEFGSSMTEEEKTKCKEKGFVLGKEGTYGVGTTAPAFVLAEGLKL